MGGINVQKGFVSLFSRLSAKNCFLALLGAAIQAVGVCNIHAYSGVTEGGVLGATLLIQHWLHISPAVSSLVLNAACYLLGWHTLGREFIWYSILAGGGFSLFYAICEPFAPLWPALRSLRRSPSPRCYPFRSSIRLQPCSFFVPSFHMISCSMLTPLLKRA